MKPNDDLDFRFVVNKISVDICIWHHCLLLKWCYLDWCMWRIFLLEYSCQMFTLSLGSHSHDLYLAAWHGEWCKLSTHTHTSHMYACQVSTSHESVIKYQHIKWTNNAESIEIHHPYRLSVRNWQVAVCMSALFSSSRYPGVTCLVRYRRCGDMAILLQDITVVVKWRRRTVWFSHMN